MSAAARIRAILDGSDRSFAARLLVALLVPASWLFTGVIALRNGLFDQGGRSVYSASVPVISVGNLTAGGTGKTPFVDFLVKQLLHRRQRVAIVSRGYGGGFSGKAAFVSDGQSLLLDAATAGDEPVLLARRNPGVPVVIARRRAEGLRLLARAADVSCVVLDDAFQHRQVHRDLDIVLLDARAPFGNGFVQPAGLLREPAASLRRADLAVFTRATAEIKLPSLPLPVMSSRHVLDSQCMDLEGQVRLLAEFVDQKIFAFAGIAEPAAFFSSLRSQGLTLCGALALPDHCVYDAPIIDRINAASAGADLLLTTEKDAVKLASAPIHMPCYAVAMTLVIDDTSLLQKHLGRLFPDGEMQ